MITEVLKEVKVSERGTCRASKGKLVDVLDLGYLPFSCFPERRDAALPLLPLQLCLNEESGLLQLRHSVDPDAMYSEYWYMSGVNQSMKMALREIVEQAVKRVGGLEKDAIVVDIASNDGTLLSAYPESVFRVGIDPAKNIVPKACDLHINTYFSAECYREKLGERKAEIVTSIAMFYDLEDPIRFSSDVGAILKKGGLWVIELSYLPTMLEQNSFDTVCSEHLEYYSLTSMEYILARSGMEVEDVELNDVNGGSFRLYIRHKGHARETDAVRRMRQNEKGLKLTDPSTYVAFGKRVERNKREMLEFLERAKREGKKVIGYGASTKGNTILSYYGIDEGLVSYVADRNPIKWGRFTVTGIPIVSEDEARAMRPDYFLAFPYHFMREFLQRERPFLEAGGKFVAPIPSLKILGA